MKFTGLKESYRFWCSGALERIENKQRLSLSHSAYWILMNDQGIFLPEETGEQPTSLLINRIFERFKDLAESSVALMLQNQKQALSKALEELPDKDAAVNLLLAREEDRLSGERSKRLQPKDHTLTLRIHKENLKYLLSEEGQAEGPGYRDNVGLYFKAVLEEYAQLPQYRREQIFYRQTREQLQLALEEKKLLKLVLRSRGRRGEVSANHILYMKPLGLQQDSERLYNYLVGYVCASREGPWNLGSVRLTSVLECIKQERTVSLTLQQQRDAQMRIRDLGVQYLAGEATAQQIRVRLTPEGQRRYQIIRHLRPRVLQQDQQVYTFYCTLRQAETYFFQFGHHARVLEPESLAQLLQRRYASALRQYEGE